MIGLMKKNSVELIESYLDELYPDPKCELNYTKDYELLIATLLSAQTTDKRVNEVTKILFKKYDIFTLANADITDIESLIKSVGTYHLKAKYIIGLAQKLIDDYNGIVPNNREYLLTLPGVGRKTVNVVLSNLFNETCIAVDTHVNRVSKRLSLAVKDDSVLKVEEKLMQNFNKKNWSRRHHQLVLFGRYFCKAKNPICGNCKLTSICHKNYSSN